MNLDERILATYFRLRAQTSHAHARDMACQTYGITPARLARLIVASCPGILPPHQLKPVNGQRPDRPA